MLILAAQQTSVARITVTVADEVADLPEQPQAARTGPAGRRNQHDDANPRQGRGFARAFADSVRERPGPGAEGRRAVIRSEPSPEQAWALGIKLGNMIGFPPANRG